VFGAKLTFKLLMMFGVVAMLPGLVVYGASVFFLNRSIETWFDVRVDNALTSGVNLGQAALDDLLRDLDTKAQRMALTLSDEGMGSIITRLSILREQSAVQEMTLFDERGGVIAHVSGERGTLLPVLPDRSVLWQVGSSSPTAASRKWPSAGSSCGSSCRCIPARWPAKPGCCNWCSRCPPSWRATPRRCSWRIGNTSRSRCREPG
jgi:hypothetical protein